MAREGVFDPLGLSERRGSARPAGGPAPWANRAALTGGLRRRAAGARRAGRQYPLPLGPARAVHLSGGECALNLRVHLVREADYLSADSWERLHRAEGPGGLRDGLGRYGRRTAPLGVEHHVVRARCASTRPRAVAVFVAVNAAFWTVCGPRWRRRPRRRWQKRRSGLRAGPIWTLRATLAGPHPPRWSYAPEHADRIGKDPEEQRRRKAPRRPA